MVLIHLFKTELLFIFRAKDHEVSKHSDVSAEEMMDSPSSMLKLAVLLLASITSAYPPTCSPFFGSPNERDCYQLIHGPPHRQPINHYMPRFLRNGIRNSGNSHNFFGVVSVAQPAEVSDRQVSVLTLSLVLGPLTVCPVP